jgi:UDP-glucuronate 4-epimerase
MAYFRLMANALGKADFVLFGDGKIKRDFTFIKDVTRTTVKLMQELSVRNSGFHDVVNIGGQRPLSMEYLMSQVSLTVNSELSYKIASTDPSDSLETAADNSYLLSLIGEQNFTPLEQGIDLFAQWMKSEKVLSRVSNWIKSVP